MASATCFHPMTYVKKRAITSSIYESDAVSVTHQED